MDDNLGLIHFNKFKDYIKSTDFYNNYNASLDENDNWAEYGIDWNDKPFIKINLYHWFKSRGIVKKNGVEENYEKFIKFITEIIISNCGYYYDYINFEIVISYKKPDGKNLSDKNYCRLDREYSKKEKKCKYILNKSKTSF